MPNYEIMLIIDPSKTANEVKKFVEPLLKKISLFEDREIQKLAYPINNSKVGRYILLNATIDPQDIKEFTRKVNISKFIWRYLVVNLDKEKAMDTVKHIRTVEEVEKLRQAYMAKREANFARYNSTNRHYDKNKKTDSTFKKTTIVKKDESNTDSKQGK